MWDSDTKAQMRVGTLTGEIVKCQNPWGLPMGGTLGFHIDRYISLNSLQPAGNCVSLTENIVLLKSICWCSISI